MNPVQNSLVILARLDRKLQTQESANKSLTGFKIQDAFTIISRWTKPLGSAKQAQNQAGYCKSLNAPWELSQLALRQDYAKKIWQAAQTGQVLFEFKFTTAKMYKLSYKNKAVFCPLLLFNLSKQQTLCIFLYQ